MLYPTALPSYTDLSSVVMGVAPASSHEFSSAELVPIENAGGLDMSRVYELLSSEEAAVVDVCQDPEAFAHHRCRQFLPLRLASPVVCLIASRMRPRCPHGGSGSALPQLLVC